MPLPNAISSGLSTTYSANTSAVTLTPNTAGGMLRGPGVSGNIFTPANAGSGGTVSYSLNQSGEIYLLQAQTGSQHQEVKVIKP